MLTDSQYILERISQGCVTLSDGEFVIDRLVKYFGNGRIRWHVEFRGHRIELTTGQLKKQRPSAGRYSNRLACCRPSVPGPTTDDGHSI